MAIPISVGAGTASIASEKVGDNDYQQIKLVGGETGSTSVLGITPDGSAKVSVIGVVNIAGSVVASGTVNATITALPSVSGALNISGSVMLGSSNASVITVIQNSSLIAINAGSVIAVPSGSVITVWGKSPSVVGSYAEDTAHVPADKGLFTLGVRNDFMASVTSTDGDYSQIAVGPSGETVAVDAPYARWVSGVADLRVVQGASVTAIAAQGASVFTYVREVQIANFGSASVLVKIGGGLGSTLGWTIAPAGGGSNFTTRYKTGENSAVTASINGTASVLVTLSGFTARI